MMDERLKTTEDARPLIREECIVETVLEIIGRATVIEDGVERQIGPHDIHGVLYHLREACLATQRLRARQSKPAMRAIKQLGTALRKANQSKGGVPEDIRLVLGLDRMIHHLAAYGKAQRKPKPDAIRKRLAADYAVSHYDVTFAVADPNPESASARGPDPILDGSSAPTAAPSSATRALLDRPSSQGAA
jgi:hypothetical protein